VVILRFKNSTFCSQSELLRILWVLEQTATISMYSIKWLSSHTTGNVFTVRYELNP